MHYNVYAPVARYQTIKMFIANALQNNQKMTQLDIPTAFLHGELDIEIYLKIPEGVTIDKECNVVKLKKALYGLREAPRKCNERFNKFTEKNGLRRSGNDFCLYIGDKVWLLLWVDDIIISGTNSPIIIKELENEFAAKNLGELKNFLGMEIKLQDNKNCITQATLIEKMLTKFKMEECKPAITPMMTNFQVETLQIKENIPYRELIGSLLYVATISRPDITYAVVFLSRFLDKPTEQLWQAAKRILRYLKYTQDLALIYERTSPTDEDKLLAYADADWGGDHLDRKSVSGCIVYFNNNPVSWSSKKQNVVAQSSYESEYIASAWTTSELIYLKGIHKDLSVKNVQTTLMIDNQSALQSVQRYENSRRSKHIDIKAHFIKDIVAKGLIELKYVPSSENVADMFTKPLPKDKFEYFRNRLNVK